MIRRFFLPLSSNARKNWQKEAQHIQLANDMHDFFSSKKALVRRGNYGWSRNQTFSQFLNTELTRLSISHRIMSKGRFKKEGEKKRERKKRDRRRRGSISLLDFYPIKFIFVCMIVTYMYTEEHGQNALFLYIYFGVQGPGGET